MSKLKTDAPAGIVLDNQYKQASRIFFVMSGKWRSTLLPVTTLVIQSCFLPLFHLIFAPRYVRVAFRDFKKAQFAKFKCREDFMKTNMALTYHSPGKFPQQLWAPSRTDSDSDSVSDSVSVHEGLCNEETWNLLDYLKNIHHQ